jgi:hypothetical protein
MATRPLLTGDEPGSEIGTVTWDGETLTLDGAAEGVFDNLRDFMGDDALGETLIREGWSNGYLWLGDPEDGLAEVIGDGGQPTAGE